MPEGRIYIMTNLQLNISTILVGLIVLVCSVILIVLSLLLGKTLLYFFYRQRIRGTKEPTEFSDIKIPPSVQELVNRFDPDIRIRIKDAPLSCTSLASFSRKPTIIILSKRLFDTKENNIEQFDDNDILTCVAHELGHSIPQSHFIWLLRLFGSGVAGTFLLWILWMIVSKSLAPALFTFFLEFTFAGAILLGSASREEEKRADEFAIIRANIPVEIFIKSILKLWHAIQKEPKKKDGKWDYLMSSIQKLVFESHPPIEQRIIRVRTLYK